MKRHREENSSSNGISIRVRVDEQQPQTFLVNEHLLVCELQDTIGVACQINSSAQWLFQNQPLHPELSLWDHEIRDGDEIMVQTKRQRRVKEEEDAKMIADLLWGKLTSKILAYTRYVGISKDMRYQPNQFMEILQSNPSVLEEYSLIDRVGWALLQKDPSRFPAHVEQRAKEIQYAESKTQWYNTSTEIPTDIRHNHPDAFRIILRSMKHLCTNQPKEIVEACMHDDPDVFLEHILLRRRASRYKTWKDIPLWMFKQPQELYRLLDLSEVLRAECARDKSELFKRYQSYKQEREAELKQQYTQLDDIPFEMQQDLDQFRTLLQRCPHLLEELGRTDPNGYQLYKDPLQTKFNEYWSQKVLEQKHKHLFQNKEDAWTHNSHTVHNLNSHMIYVPIQINKKSTYVIVDSGCGSTSMNEKHAKELGLQNYINREYKSKCYGVGTTNVVGRILSCPLQIGKNTVHTSINILEGDKVPFLFGVESMRKYKMKLDFGQDVLIIGEEAIPFLSKEEADRLDMEHRRLHT